MNCIGMFAKYWQPGQVKTRLACGIGPDGAAQVYRSFVGALATRFESVADRRLICFAPRERRNEFAELAEPHWAVVPQSEGDLGQRMSDFFQQAFQAGAERVVLIGSDSPTLPGEHVDLAFQLLAECEVVLGPTSDGGYYLIGAAGATPPVFDGIAWSTPEVFPQTLERLATAGLTYQQLPSWYDVDELADLLRLREELLRLQAAEAWCETLLAAVEEVL